MDQTPRDADLCTDADLITTLERRLGPALRLDIFEESAISWYAFSQYAPGLAPDLPYGMDFVEYTEVTAPWRRWLENDVEYTPAYALLLTEALWCVATKAPRYRIAICAALLRKRVPVWVLSQDGPLSLNALAFGFSAVVEALQLRTLDEDEKPRKAPETMAVRDRNGQVHEVIPWPEVLENLTLPSTLPACVAYWRWICDDFVPAILRTGYYNPRTGHEPPPGQELDALEAREELRDLMKDLFPVDLKGDHDGS